MATTDPDLQQAIDYWTEQQTIWQQQQAAVAALEAPPDAAQRVYDAWWPYVRGREQAKADPEPLDPTLPPMPEYPL
jgi:hypothetical protein